MQAAVVGCAALRVAQGVACMAQQHPVRTIAGHRQGSVASLEDGFLGSVGRYAQQGIKVLLQRTAAIFSHAAMARLRFSRMPLVYAPLERMVCMTSS